MRRAPVVGLLIVVASARAEPGAVVLAQRFGGKGLDHGWGLGFDRAGNLVLSGFGSDPLDLGGGVLAPRDEDGLFVASYTPAGVHRWSLRLPLGPAFYAGPMAVAAGGAALLVGDRGSSLFFRRISKGRVTASVDLEQASGLGVTAFGSGAVIVGTSRASGQSFLEARAADGRLSWRQELDGNGVAVGAAGDDVVVAGSRAGDIFVERRTAAGAVVWAQRLGRPDFDEKRVQLAVTADSHVLVGYTSTHLTAALLTPSGNVAWSRELAGINVGGVAVGARGEYAVSGDGRVTKLDAAGKVLWQRQLTADELMLEGVAVDASGRTCVTGWFAGTLVAGSRKLAGAVGYDVLLVCMER